MNYCSYMPAMTFSGSDGSSAAASEKSVRRCLVQKKEMAAGKEEDVRREREEIKERRTKCSNISVLYFHLRP